MSAYTWIALIPRTKGIKVPLVQRMKESILEIVKLTDHLTDYKCCKLLGNFGCAYRDVWLMVTNNINPEFHLYSLYT